MKSDSLQNVFDSRNDASDYHLIIINFSNFASSVLEMNHVGSTSVNSAAITLFSKTFYSPCIAGIMRAILHERNTLQACLYVVHSLCNLPAGIKVVRGQWRIQQSFAVSTCSPSAFAVIVFVMQTATKKCQPQLFFPGGTPHRLNSTYY